jgi:hypothetical protein
VRPPRQSRRKKRLAARIELVTHVVAELDGREAIAEATRRDRTTGAMSIMEAQQGARA